MMSNCPICQGAPRCYTSRDLFFGSDTYVECSRCGFQTKHFHTFWASDGDELAHREWEELVSKYTYDRKESTMPETLNGVAVATTIKSHNSGELLEPVLNREGLYIPSVSPSGEAYYFKIPMAKLRGLHQLLSEMDDGR